jgi:type IV secretion system protein VirD4
MAIKFPPRGYGDEAAEFAADKRWADPTKLAGGWDYNPRKILLGQWQGRSVGDPDHEHLPPGSGDDRHIVTIAGTRAGKSRSVIVPNLLQYPGSVVVIDPKGDLAADTAVKRAAFGDVFILDPFRITNEDVAKYRAAFNPFAELDESTPETVAADAALIADALIIPGHGEEHWRDAARNLIRGLILHMVASDPSTATIKRLRELLTSSGDDLILLLDEMAASDAYDGIVGNAGKGFRAKVEGGHLSGELRSIVSTANEQTWPLDDIARISGTSDFWLSQLTATPTTIYLVLPATRIATHNRWLRIVVNLVIAAIERNPIRVEDLRAGKLPVWLVLEEFAALGYMQSVETAAGFMAGMGCKLWVVLQDLTQIKTHYKNSWETFLGNAGIIQAWSNVDVTTTEYLSKLLGNTTIVEVNKDRRHASGFDSGDMGRRETERIHAPNQPSL